MSRLRRAFDENGQVRRIGLFLLEKAGEQVGIAGIVRHGLPDGLSAAKQGHLGTRHRLVRHIHDMDRYPVIRIETPVLRMVVLFLRGHQFPPEVPVVQVVPFAGGQPAGSALPIAGPAGFRARLSAGGGFPVHSHLSVKHISVRRKSVARGLGAGKQGGEGHPQDQHLFHCLFLFKPVVKSRLLQNLAWNRSLFLQWHGI